MLNKFRITDITNQEDTPPEEQFDNAFDILKHHKGDIEDKLLEIIEDIFYEYNNTDLHIKHQYYTALAKHGRTLFKRGEL